MNIEFINGCNLITPKQSIDLSDQWSSFIERRERKYISLPPINLGKKFIKQTIEKKNSVHTSLASKGLSLNERRKIMGKLSEINQKAENKIEFSKWEYYCASKPLREKSRQNTYIINLQRNSVGNNYVLVDR